MLMFELALDIVEFFCDLVPFMTENKFIINPGLEVSMFGFFSATIIGIIITAKIVNLIVPG